MINNKIKISNKIEIVKIKNKLELNFDDNQCFNLSDNVIVLSILVSSNSEQL